MNQPAVVPTGRIGYLFSTLLLFLFSLTYGLHAQSIKSNIWLSTRSDASGAGTITDPFRADTYILFDTIMRNYSITNKYTNIAFRLHPGRYETEGVYQGAGMLTNRFWAPTNGWHIIGSGIDHTFLKLVNASINDKAYSVIGNSGNPAATNPIPGVVISDLTLDCNGSGNSGLSRLQGINLWATESAVRRVKVINAMNKQTAVESFIIGFHMYAATGSWTLVNYTNNVIEDCTIVLPTSSYNNLTSGFLNGGRGESNVISVLPVIRNCSMFGESYDKSVNGYTVVGCLGGLAENNSSLSVRFGFYFDQAEITTNRTGITHSVKVLNNRFLDCTAGCFVNIVGVSSTGRAVDYLHIEGNQIELADAGVNTTVGVYLLGISDSITTFTNAIVRNNLIQHNKGALSGSNTGGFAIVARYGRFVIDNNTFKLDKTGDDFFKVDPTGTASSPIMFNNRRYDGTLVYSPTFTSGTSQLAFEKYVPQGLLTALSAGNIADAKGPSRVFFEHTMISNNTPIYVSNLLAGCSVTLAIANGAYADITFPQLVAADWVGGSAPTWYQNAINYVTLSRRTGQTNAFFWKP